MCGGFPAQAICPLWGAKPTRFCSQLTRVSSSSSTHFWEAFGFCPTSARNAPHACLISSWACVVVVHHAFAQELIRHAWGAFLADVGQNPKTSQKWVEPEEETRVGWEQNCAGLAPQSGQIAYARNPPHKKALLRDSAHLQLLSALGIFSLFGLDTRTILLPLQRARHAFITKTHRVTFSRLKPK